MNLRDMIITLDRMNTNSRKLSGSLQWNKELQEETEACRLALEILSALQRAGANTSAEALALLRLYPMMTERNRRLEIQAAENRQMLERLKVKEQILQSLLSAALSVIQMPCELKPPTAVTVRYPDGTFVKTEGYGQATIYQPKKQEDA